MDTIQELVMFSLFTVYTSLFFAFFELAFWGILGS